VIVIVADRWDSTLGGRERYADDLVAHLTKEGRHVAKVAREHRRVAAGTPVLALTPVPQATHYQLHGGLLASAFSAERASMDSAVRRLLFGPALRLNRRRQRSIVDEHRLLRGRTALMTFSNRVARDLVERHGVSPDRVTVSRPGVNLRRFAPPPAAGRDHHDRDRPLRLAFVGHNFALKGLRSAIVAIARARRAGLDVSLSVAGRGRQAPYARLAAELRIGDRVTFAGLLSQAGVADLYRASDALIHPTFYDPFPRAAIEALACACPVITTECCGAVEVLTAGVEGLVVSHPRDVDGLVAAMTTLSDRTTLTRMRHAAAERGRQFDEAAHFRAASKWLFEGADAS